MLKKMPKKALTHQKHTPLCQGLGKTHAHNNIYNQKTPIPTSTHIGQSLALAPILPLVCVI